MKKEIAKKLAKGIALHCVRNTSIENIHAGKGIHSETGDGSDIIVKTKHGEIPWNKVSRITDEEMKLFMIEVVNKIYTSLINLEDIEFAEKFENLARRSTISWDDPIYLKAWLKDKVMNELE